MIHAATALPAWRIGLLLCTALILAACTPMAPEPEPPPDVAPLPLPPADPEPAPPVRAPAVLALMDRADGLAEQGDQEAASAALERALRLAPEDPELWHRLAALRLAQTDWAAAEALALRSLGLDDGGRWRQQNWRLIAAARRGAGDRDGAREAEARLRPG